MRSQISKQDESTAFASPENGSAIAKLSSSRFGKQSESVFWLSSDSGSEISKIKIVKRSMYNTALERTILRYFSDTQWADLSMLNLYVICTNVAH